MNSKQNVLMKKINKKVVNSMLKQASKYNLDVNPIEQDVDVKTTYNSLMKSLNYIYLLLSQVVSGIDLKATEEVQKLNRRERERELRRRGEEGYDENPNDYEDDINSRFGRLGSEGSQYPFSLGKSDAQSDAQSDYENPVSEYGSNYEDDILNPDVLYGNPQRRSRNGSVISSISSLSGLTKLGEVESSISLNSLEKEVINTKFYVEQLIGQFNLLTKIQKQKLAIIVKKINIQINHISRIYPEGTRKYTQLHNSFIYLKASLKIINEELSSIGEGVILEDGDQYEGGARLNKGIYNLHQPSKYVNASNVNMNWAYNLAQRNN